MEIPGAIFVGIGGLVLAVSMFIDIKKMALFEIVGVLLIIYGLIKIIANVIGKSQSKQPQVSASHPAHVQAHLQQGNQQGIHRSTTAPGYHHYSVRGYPNQHPYSRQPVQQKPPQRKI